MKTLKKTLLVLSLLMVLTLSACTPAQEPTAETAPFSSGNAGVSSDEWLLSFDDYAEYQNWLPKWEHKPDNYSADKLALLGEWNGIVFLNPHDAAHTSYMLSFITASGADLSIYVYHNPDDSGTRAFLDSAVVATVTEDMADLLYNGVSSPTGSKIARSSFYYDYNVEGGLLGVTWDHNGIMYYINFDSVDKLRTQILRSDKTDCIIYRLVQFDEEVASAAFAEIIQALEAD